MRETLINHQGGVGIYASIRESLLADKGAYEMSV